MIACRAPVSGSKQQDRREVRREIALVVLAKHGDELGAEARRRRI
jgi:hypothetical protein